RMLLAVYPATIGSTEKPAPSGRLTVTRVSRNPTYRYNPKYEFKGVRTDKPFTNQARTEQSGRRRLDRIIGRGLRNPWNARPRESRQDRVARLCAPDQLGCVAPRIGCREGSAGRFRGRGARFQHRTGPGQARKIAFRRGRVPGCALRKSASLSAS